MKLRNYLDVSTISDGSSKENKEMVLVLVFNIFCMTLPHKFTHTTCTYITITPQITKIGQSTDPVY